MVRDDAPWSPARPGAGWRADVAARGARPPAALPTASSPPAGVPLEEAPRRRRRTTASSSSRLRSLYLSLAAATVLVLVVGVAVVPHYGGGDTAAGTPAADELRRPPTDAAWTLDLAGLLAPDVPPACVHVWPSAATDGLVAVGTSVDLETDDAASATGCRRSAVSGNTSRVALVEAGTGRVRWVHDLADDVPDADALAIPASQVVPGAGRVLVQVQTSGGAAQVALALADGAALEVARGRRDLPAVSVAAVGRLQLRAVGGTDDASRRFSLVDAGDLTSPIWQGRADVGTTPLLLASGVVVEADGRSSFVDGRTGEARPLERGRGTTVETAATGPTGDDSLYLVERAGRDRPTVSAVDPIGDRRWTSDVEAGALAVTDRCVLALAPDASSVTCLDRGDGRALWSRDLGGPSRVVPVPGQSRDDVWVVAQRDDGPELAALDAADGSRRVALPLGPSDDVVAASRTVVYVETDDSGAGPDAVTAYDASGGRRLWGSTSAGRAAFWGGALVVVDDSAVASRLVDRTRVGSTS
ncbi:PQQ-binding-like beta-propeller repeat protein [Frigoribacterium sp. ACAM 257]|uniref:outer membrane protein assembly factor BamB family protein n=1 Tax=Frigoribacterium sp. ACAM 257 TaxID=2508998 RepID=UPI0011B9E578|nr:PQQ-binding-like beta-propeller repeat protein [Frigoribacterium sp. ACAM 257]TWX40351.1 PQQ-binding-like beta-propeller repeat protein [Frigoribacterium sp. ACAM 257]